MDPVQKAVLSHTFGTPLLKAKRPVISCNVCQIRFNSEVRHPATTPDTCVPSCHYRWASVSPTKALRRLRGAGAAGRGQRHQQGWRGKGPRVGSEGHQQTGAGYVWPGFKGRGP